MSAEINNAEQRARELLAEQWQKIDPDRAKRIRNGDLLVSPEIRAIVAALSQQPEARGVVDEAMAQRFTDALPALYAHDAPPISAVMIGLTAALTGERNG